MKIYRGKKSIPLIHIYKTVHVPGLVQALQEISGEIKIVL
jgi:hypothetical protein